MYTETHEYTYKRYLIAKFYQCYLVQVPTQWLPVLESRGPTTTHTFSRDSWGMFPSTFRDFCLQWTEDLNRLPSRRTLEF